RVSVPTLYNLFGSKHGILAAELQETFRDIARALDFAKGADSLERAATLMQAGVRSILAMPAFHRELCHVMLTAPDTQPLRHAMEEQYIGLMAANLKV